MISHVSWPLELLGCRYISLEIAPLQEANHPNYGSLQEFDRTKVSEVAPVAMSDGETGRHQFDNPYVQVPAVFECRRYTILWAFGERAAPGARCHGMGRQS
jgi:hypothetical protein